MASELVGRLGLDKSNYTKGLGEAEKDFNSFTRKTGGESKRLGGEMAEAFHGAHKVLKAFGAVMIFREFINQFKELSEWAAKFGDQTDQNIRAATRWGEAWKGSVNTFKEAGATALGYLTRAGEYIGNGFKGKSADQTDKEAADEDAALAAEKRAADFKKKNDPEKVAALRKKIAADEAEAAEKIMSMAQKFNSLEAERARITAERGKLGHDDILKQLELTDALAGVEKKMSSMEDESNAKTKEVEDRKLSKEKELQKLKEEHLKEFEKREENEIYKIAELKAKMATTSTDRSKMTLKELANIGRFTPGAAIGLEDAAEQAREALKLQDKAAAARLTGDVGGAQSLFAQSDAMVHALAGPGGPLRSTENPESAQQVEELKNANRTLDEIKKEIAVLTTAQ